MKLYVAVRFKGLENKSEVEEFCKAVKESGFEDFCFVRDVENYQKVFDDPKELWIRAKAEIENCDGLLVDTSDKPSGGRVVEIGIAYALNLPIFEANKKGVTCKPVFKAIATDFFEYEDFNDLTSKLAELHQKR